MTAFTIRVPDEVADRLNQIAQKLDHSRSYMAAQAIEDFVSRVIVKYVKTTSRS